MSRVTSGKLTISVLTKRLAYLFPQLVESDVRFAVHLLLDAMAESLALGQRIEIRGFGSFGLSYRPPRKAYNVRARRMMRLPERFIPRFRPADRLRDDVDGAP